MSDLLCAVDTSRKAIDTESYINLSLPYKLTEGEYYLYMDRWAADIEAVIRDVQFVAYTSCPAIVVVLDGSGHKVRVLRENLYLSSDSKNVISKNKWRGVKWSSA